MVVRMLRRGEHIRWSRLNGLKKRLQWKSPDEPRRLTGIRVNAGWVLFYPGKYAVQLLQGMVAYAQRALAALVLVDGYGCAQTRR